MKVIDQINKRVMVDMMKIDPENSPCILEVSIKLTQFDDLKFEGSIIAKEDGYVRYRTNILNLSKRAVNNRLKKFGISI